MINTGLTAAQGYGGIALSLALGLLVGIQRGWAQRQQAEGSRFAGIRTFGLLGLAGGLAGYLFGESEAIATIILAATAALILISYYRVTQDGGTLSGTASLVGLLTMACGFMAAKGAGMAATAIAVSMVLLLAMRSQLHQMVGRMSELEVVALARFALIAMVILPLLPDRAFGPFDAWNPRQLWLVVVLVSGFSLAGYVAAKLLGPSRGTVAMAATGAVVSSTAVTASLASRLREPDANVAILHSGISVASAVMFARVMVLTGALAPFALPTLAMLAVPGLLVSLTAAAWQLWRARKVPAEEAESIEVRNPFSIGPALFLMALVMATSLIARWVLEHYGDAGLATVLAVTGTVDVDSAIITMGGLPPGTLGPRIAGLALLPPILLNSLLKAGATVSIAGWRRGGPAALPLVASVAASLAALPFVL